MSKTFNRKYSEYQKKKMQTAMTVSVVHEISPKEKQAATAQNDSKPAITYKRKRKDVVTFEEPKSKKKTSTKSEKKKRLVKPRKLRLLGCIDEINHFNCNHPPIPTGHESATNVANSSSVGAWKSPMQRRAEEVYNNVSSPRSPCFIKKMSKSHVSRGFWLALEKKFCVEHLPKQDKMIRLQVGDNEREYYAKYLKDRCGLSGGWGRFSKDHKLVVEDVLVFQLVEPCKFKVHIIRRKSFAEIDGATSLLKLKFHAEPQIIEDEVMNMEEETASDNSLELVASHAENDDNEDTGDFHINEIPLRLREKYYELCGSQKTLLHKNLNKSFNTTLAVGIISQTIDIADAIRAANASTGVSQLRSWDTTLKAFEELGMTVRFLRARIDMLLTVSPQLQAQIEQKRTERAEAIDLVRRLVEKLPDLENMIGKLSEELDGLVVKNEEVTKASVAPW